MRRQRPVWLSSINPQNIVYDAENDDYRDGRWGEQPDQLQVRLVVEAFWPIRCGSSISLLPWWFTASITVCQSQPRLAAPDE